MRNEAHGLQCVGVIIKQETQWMVKSRFQEIIQNHFIAMALCCAIPLAGILALSSLGVLGSWGYFALLLICPLGHLFMMGGIHAHSQKVKVQTQLKQKALL